jgi:hypothetical protein
MVLVMQLAISTEISDFAGARMAMLAGAKFASTSAPSRKIPVNKTQKAKK